MGRDGTILSQAVSDYISTDAIITVLEGAGLEINGWVVNFPAFLDLRSALSAATLYVTLEPSTEYCGAASPPSASLIEQAGIRRVVIGCHDPVQERRVRGASALHAAGIRVSVGNVLKEECEQLIQFYTELATNKLQNTARKHVKLFGRPLGFLHCAASEADVQKDEALKTSFNGGTLSFHNISKYGLEPPGYLTEGDFGKGEVGVRSLIAWYGQVDAVIVTFPSKEFVYTRMFGLEWLASQGRDLSPGVERVVVMDTADLLDLPLTNDDPSLPNGLDAEALWAAKLDRKPIRILLTGGGMQQLEALAQKAAAIVDEVARAASEAADALESGGEPQASADAMINCQNLAQSSAYSIRKDAEETAERIKKLKSKGISIETIDESSGNLSLDVMKHLGDRNGLHTVVWRAGDDLVETPPDTWYLDEQQ